MAVVLNKHSYMRWYEPECVKMNNEVEKKPWEVLGAIQDKTYKRTGFYVVFIILLHRCWLQMNTVGLFISNQ